MLVHVDTYNIEVTRFRPELEIFFGSASENTVVAKQIPGNVAKGPQYVSDRSVVDRTVHTCSRRLCYMSRSLEESF